MFVTLCVSATLNIWTKWHQRPATVNFDGKTRLISMIPLPSVSICTTNKFVNKKIDTDSLMDVLRSMYANKTANVLQLDALAIHVLDGVDISLSLFIKLMMK